MKNNKQQTAKINYLEHRHLLRYDLSRIKNIEKYTIMNNTETAVQKLRAKLMDILPTTIDYNTQIALSNAFIDAEKDEKEQIKNAFVNGFCNAHNTEDKTFNADTIFYNETYGGNK